MITPRSLSISSLVEGRPDDQLADDVHRALRLAARDADPVDGGLAVGRGVEAAADALDRLGDGARRGVARRALEGEVLHEVGDAGLLGGLEARAGEDVRRDGDRTRPGQAGADDARPLWQRGPFEHRRMVQERDAAPRPAGRGAAGDRAERLGSRYFGAPLITTLDPVLQEEDQEGDARRPTSAGGPRRPCP